MGATPDDHELLVRIDERTKRTEARIGDVEKKLDNLDQHYVSEAQFEPVKRIVYGLVALVLTAVATAVVAAVLNVKDGVGG